MTLSIYLTLFKTIQQINVKSVDQNSVNKANGLKRRIDRTESKRTDKTGKSKCNKKNSKVNETFDVSLTYHKIYEAAL